MSVHNLNKYIKYMVFYTKYGTSSAGCKENEFRVRVSVVAVCVEAVRLSNGARARFGLCV